MRNRILATSLLATASFAFWGASLFLPVADAGDIHDFVPGILLLFYGLVGLFSFELLALGLVWGASYLCVPLSCLAAIWSRKLAAFVAACSLGLPVYLLATEGLMITNRRTHEKALAVGIICLFLASTLMLGAWVLAGWFNVRRNANAVGSACHGIQTAHIENS